MTIGPTGTNFVLGSNRHIQVKPFSSLFGALCCDATPLVGKVFVVTIEFVLTLVMIQVFSDGR